MTKDGAIISQRDIVLIPFPYSDLSQHKKRPVVVISGKEYNKKNSDLICCAITSNPRDYANSILISTKDLDTGTLNYDSKIKPNKVFTLEQNKVIKHIGRLNISKSKEVVSNLNICIKIDE